MTFAGMGIGGLLVLVLVAILLANTGARRIRNAPLAGVCGGLLVTSEWAKASSDSWRSFCCSAAGALPS